MDAEKFIDETIVFLNEDIEAFEEDKLTALAYCDNKEELEESQLVCDAWINAYKVILNLFDNYKKTKEGPKEYYTKQINKILREDKLKKEKK